ncbi:MAG: NUDIX domain-containing protein [Gordonia sp. (in: high G+C Gram-positive bacteria)]|uniref:NUDIX domain-containing protein n=1 Tax=Gordonia sp. (in: high G+C Gram-positive bacteria) TaxID=84139 RepID=UPI003BB49CAF
MTPALTASAHTTLTGWTPPTAEQDALRYAYLAFVDAAANPCERACVPGHLTASAIVFDATGTHVLLTLHPRVGKWVQLGGHCEPADATLAAAALREATEESGLPNLALSAAPVQLHTHPITCSLGQPTRHLDVRYAAVAPATATATPPPPVISNESIDLAWWPVNALPENVDAESIPALIALGRDSLRAAAQLG